MTPPSKPVWVFSTLLTASLVAFGAALLNPFLFDDVHVIAENLWLTWERIPAFYRSFLLDSQWGFAGYRPTLMATLAVGRELHGLSPFGFRLTNLLLHTGVAFLIFLLAKRVFQRFVRESADSLALLGALLFLLHPVQTNVITLVWKRSDLLFSVGVLGSLLLFQDWAEQRKGLRALALGFGLSLVAFTSKESCLVFPLLILLFDLALWDSKRSIDERIVHLYVPLLLLWAFYAWLILLRMPAALSEIHYQLDAYTPPSLQLDRWTYLKTQAVSFLEYLRLLVWPAGLNIYHHIPPVRSFTDSRFLLGTVSIFLFVAIAIRSWSRHRVLALAISWFLLTLAPGTSLFPLHLPFDEDRLYLPMFGAVLAALYGLHLFTGIAETKQWNLLPRILPWVPLAALLLYLPHDILRVRTWSDSVRLWGMNVRDEPNDVRAQVNFAQALSQAGRKEEALKRFSKARAFDPDYALAPLMQGITSIEMGRWSEAREALHEVLQLKGFRGEALEHLGVVEAHTGNTARAARLFIMSAELRKRNPIAMRRLSRLLETLGQDEAAFRVLRTTILLHPIDPNTQLHLAYFLLRKRNDRKGAQIVLDQFRKARPQDPRGHELQVQLNSDDPK